MQAAWTIGLLLGVLGAGADKEGAGVGPRIEDFRLQDQRGAFHTLADAKDRKLIVVAFLSTECPLATKYAPRLAELEKTYGPRGVAFFGVCSGVQDTLAAMAHLERTADLSFPLLKDPDGALATQFGAQRTPEVFVLDSDRKVCYRGRIDDQYGVGFIRPNPTRRDLAIALDELLEGKPVSEPVTKATGCFIGRTHQSKKPGDGAATVTYTNQVSRILQDRCVVCHRKGQIAPFSLTSYKQASAWADSIVEVTQERRMPPWHASPEFGKFSNESRLSDDELKLINTWVEQGTPEGDPADLPPPPKFADGWRISKPDLVVTMPEEFTVPAEGEVPYKYFIVDPGLKEDTWIQASEAKAGNPAVVHHIIVFAMPPGRQGRGGVLQQDWLAATSPGLPPQILPEGTAKIIPAGSKLIFQVHYTPNGRKQTDKSSVGFVFADMKTVKKRMVSQAITNERLKIPANTDDFRAEATYKAFPQDVILYSLLPHMHLRGKSFRFEAIYPDGTSEVLLDVPHYDFSWQNTYMLAEPKRLPEGTKLHCIATYDNSEHNLSNPDPNATVKWGDQTWDEMLVGYFDMALAGQDLTAGAPEVKPADDGKFEVTFHFRPDTPADAVYLAGTFNEWKPDDLKMDGPDANGRYTKTLTLPAGRVEYKFLINGKTWKADPGNREQSGFFNNSLLVLGNPATAKPPAAGR